MSLDIDSMVCVANLLLDPVLFLRKDGTILAANRFATRNFGLTLQDGETLTLHNISSSAPDQIDTILKRFTRVTAPLFDELIMQSRDGVLTPYRCDGARLPGETGGDAILMVRFRSKEQVSQNFGHLNDRLYQMESAIRFERSTNRALHEKGHAKSLLLAQLGHELRSPLNAVLGFASMLQMEATKRQEAGRMTEYSRLIGDAGQYLLNIINNVMDATRLETGNFSLDEEVINLKHLVEEAVTLSATHVDGHQDTRIHLNLDIGPAAQQVIADKSALKQVIINLVGNALKFTPDNGEIEVNAGLHPVRGVYVQVKDNGPGVSAQDIQTIFEPFHQAGQEHVVGKRRGAGLGLGISKRLVEMHGGILDFTSTVGVGTDVTIWLPITRLQPLLENMAG